MAQKGSGKRRQAPAYSADAMAVRYMAGLVLIALGVLVFMAVALKLQGNIFEGLRRLCFGLCGIMAFVLPALPVWAGVLVIWSTQRRAPVRPWLFAFLAFIGLCTFMMVTGAMQYLRDHFGNQWGTVINGAYTDCAGRMESAGGGGSALATGGMSTKLTAAEICMEAGTDMFILNGSKPLLIYEALEGKQVGTKFIGKGK